MFAKCLYLVLNLKHFEKKSKCFDFVTNLPHFKKKSKCLIDEKCVAIFHLPTYVWENDWNYSLMFSILNIIYVYPNTSYICVHVIKLYFNKQFLNYVFFRLSETILAWKMWQRIFAWIRNKPRSLVFLQLPCTLYYINNYFLNTYFLKMIY